MPLLADYLRALAHKRASGHATGETTYYGPLEALLDAAGAELRPRVHAVGQLRNVGAGHPDFGLFTSGQLAHIEGGAPRPARGVVEVKALGEEIGRLLDPSTKEGAQVERYRRAYGAVLVTNYRTFVLVGTSRPLPGSKPHAEERERFELAASEADFWALAARPDEAEAALGADFGEFIGRVLRHNAPISDPRDLAQWLASFAKQARLKLERADVHRLDALRESLEQALGVSFRGERGERFFIATVVQTLYYGLFSAWALWTRDEGIEPDKQDFYWRGAGSYLRVPALQAIFDELTKSSNVRALDLTDDLNRAAALLNRVRHDQLFSRFEDHKAIEYFYEPFLEAYDPELREEYGVWYTPRQLVDYQVERVDTVLRKELGRPDGLADPGVVVLDPAAGTGAYLLSCLRRIERTLRERGDGMVEAELREAAATRLVGFEILTAPFVVAHLQLGLFMREKGVPFAEGQRAAVFLTNALTGWTEGGSRSLPIPELAAERDAAERVKREADVLVVLGNPPYEALADVPAGEERELREPYRVTARAPEPTGRATNDLYVRFYRVAERAIVERPPQHGVVCFVTKSVWLDGSGLTGMRERYLDVFSRIWVDNLHGDSRKTGKRTPDGRPDPSVFSLGGNRSSIRVGTAVATLVRHPGEDEASEADVLYRELWGETKLTELAATPGIGPEARYQRLELQADLGYPFIPRSFGDGYLEWPRLIDLFQKYPSGVISARADLVVDIDEDVLRRRIGAYFDPSRRFEDLAEVSAAAVKSTGRFDARAARAELLARGVDETSFVRYLYRPFDVRWFYWERETKLIEEKRHEYRPHVMEGNVWMIAQASARKAQWRPPEVTSVAGDYDVMDKGATYIPLYLRPDEAVGELFPSSGAGPVPNLSPVAWRYLAEMGMREEPEALFFHAIATLHAPAYRNAHAGALLQDWPRVPLPTSAEALRASAALGRRVAALLDVERPVDGVTTGRVAPELRTVAVPKRLDGRPFNPSGGDAIVTAGWGRRQKGAVYSGKGWRTERPLSEAEADDMGGAAHMLGAEGGTFDVHLNEVAVWANVPEAVWVYRLGGYPVLRKWLSYREVSVLGRELTAQEVRHFQQAARRIAAVLLLEPELDEAHAACLDAVTTEA